MAPKSALTNPGPIEFDAVLEREDQTGASCYLQVPIDLKTTYGKGTLVPVIATFDHRIEYRGSLAAMGLAHAVIGVRKQFLAELGKSEGDTIHVRIELDTAPRVITLPDDARAAVEANSAAAAFWPALSYTHQREYAEWIESAKRPETRVARIERAVALLAAGKKVR